MVLTDLSKQLQNRDIYLQIYKENVLQPLTTAKLTENCAIKSNVNLHDQFESAAGDGAQLERVSVELRRVLVELVSRPLDKCLRRPVQEE